MNRPIPRDRQLRTAWPGTHSRSLIAAVCGAMLILSGCATTRIFEPGAALQGELQAGDTMLVWLHGGGNLELTVEESTAGHIVGVDAWGTRQTIPLEEIAQVEIMETSTVRSAGQLIAVSVFLLGIALAFEGAGGFAY